jgi:hypothetical protein
MKPIRKRTSVPAIADVKPQNRVAQPGTVAPVFLAERHNHNPSNFRSLLCFLKFGTISYARRCSGIGAKAHWNTSKQHYFRRNTMTNRTLAASVLALGLLAPSAFADPMNTSDSQGCPEIRMKNAAYADCNADRVNPTNDSFGVVVKSNKFSKSNGDYIGESNEEKNQRSNN